MSEYMFGSGTTFVPDELANKIFAVAAEHGATFISGKFPDGYKYWFACRDYGSPFNERTERMVLEALSEAGLWLPGTMKKRSEQAPSHIARRRVFIVPASPPWRVTVEWANDGGVADDPKRLPDEGMQHANKSYAYEEASTRAARYPFTEASVRVLR